MSDFRLTVLNPGGKDLEQDFGQDNGTIYQDQHPPTSYHAFAACTAGSFQNKSSGAIARAEPVLLLINSNLKLCLKSIRRLKMAGLKVAVSLKETGTHQFHRHINSPARLRLFREILHYADGIISPVQELLPLYQSLTERNQYCCFIPTPYPLHDTQWDFSVPVDRRHGVFVGTRSFKRATRRHLQSLIMLRRVCDELKIRLTMIDKRPQKLLSYLRSIGYTHDAINHSPPLPYRDYLKLMADHRLVFQLDCSMVPGQVGGDAALCRSLCVGGNGSINQLVFSDYCGTGQNAADLLEKVNKLMVDDQAYQKAIELSHQKATEHIAYPVVAAALEVFFSR